MTAPRAREGNDFGGSSSNHRRRYERMSRSASASRRGRLHRPEVLADDVGAGPQALEGEDVEQVVGLIADVGAVLARGVLGDPEEPEQPHDVVEAEAAGVAEPGPDRLDERLVGGGAELPRVERRKPPVLSLGVVLVRRSADRHPGSEHVLPDPGVGPTGVAADGQVLHQPDAGAGRFELPVDQPLQPHVELNLAGMLIGVLANLEVGRVAKIHRPPAPVAPVLTGQHAVHGEAVQGVATLVGEAVEGLMAGEAAEDRTQHPQLEGQDRIAVDRARAVQTAAGGHGRLEVDARGCGAGHLLHAEIERAPEAATTWVVGTGLLQPRHRDRRVQRVEQQQVAAVARGPLPEPSKVGEVPNAPRGLGPHGIELHGPAPDPQVRREVAATGGDDEADPMAVGLAEEPVVTERRRDQGAGHALGPAVLGLELPAAGDIEPLALTHDPDGRAGGRRVGIGAHRFQDRTDRRRRGLVPHVVDVEVSRIDAPGTGGPLRIVGAAVGGGGHVRRTVPGRVLP